MLFNIEVDSGAQVTGYIVPDGYSGIPTIRVCCQGRELHRFPANEFRHALVQAGRHETGQCGFTIDSSAVPGLADLADLEIYDGETDLLVYRRPRADRIPKKLLRVETHLFPLWGLDLFIAPKFQYFAKGIENLGRESVTQLFLLNQADSVYLSGRLLYKNYAYFIEAGFQTLVMLQNPYEELAERLLVLSKTKKVGAGHLGIREAVSLEPVMAFAESLPTQDEKALRRALRQMPAEVAALLSNPLVRQLTAATPDEMPGGGAVAAALDILANSVLVGMRHAPAKFLNGFAEFLQIDPAILPTLPKFAPVTALAQQLKDSGEVDAILEKDHELYHYVEAAFDKAT
jgi:hypothetical protein